MQPRTLFLSGTVLSLCLGASGGEHAAAEKLEALLRGIRAEAVRSNNEPAGRPLPLAAHWNRGSKPTGFSPAYQLQLLRAGHHIMPWFEMPVPGRDR
jgi:hypothetical protein